MSELKRLCPECGAANAYERLTCHACAARIQSHLPVPLGERLPVPWKEVKASLTVGAAVLALRAGLGLARLLRERRAPEPVQMTTRTSLPAKITRRFARRAKPEPVPQPERQVKIWGRRVWRSWHSDGTRHLQVEEFHGQAITNDS